MDRVGALKLLDEVAELLKRADDLGMREIRAPDKYLMWLFSRTRSTYVAARLLIRESLLDEAMQLTRSLMTDALRLLELNRVGSEREAYLLHWVNESLTEWGHLIKEAVRVGIEDDPQPVLRKIDEHPAALTRYQERHEIGRLKRLRSEKQLAIQHRLEHEYWDFEYVNNVVHGSPLIADHRIARRDDGTMLLMTYLRDDDWTIRTALMVAQWALHAYGGFLGAMAPEMGRPTEIAAYLARIETANQELGASTR